jgi:hypothetical protein
METNITISLQICSKYLNRETQSAEELIRSLQWFERDGLIIELKKLIGLIENVSQEDKS